ncbi:MAG: RNA polymerase sigma factor [Myxococcota bacterium]
MKSATFLAAIGKERASERRTDVDGAIHLHVVEDVGLAEDHRLLQEAASGDRAATRALYRQHVDAVHRQVARILGASDGDVEDVVQKVFLAVLEGANRFRGQSKVSSWIMGIAVRRALDEARARTRRARWAKVGQFFGMSQQDAPVHVRGEAEHYLRVLTPEQRAVFLLKEVEGYTFQEISEMSGIGVSTLHARLKAARRRLDTALEGEGRDA